MSFVTPTAAPAKSLPFASLAEFGNSMDFSISFMVISPLSLKSSSTKGSFSILYCFMISRDSSMLISIGAVLRFSLVITSSIFLVMSFSNLISRFVSIPTNVFDPSTMGTPDILYLSISSRASATIWSLDK